MYFCCMNLRVAALFTLFVQALLLCNGTLMAQDSCLVRARALLREGDYEQSIQVLKTCATYDSLLEYKEVYAYALFLSGELSESLALLESFPDSSLTNSARHLKGRIHMSRGEYHAAYSSFSRLIATDSANVMLVRQLAQCADQIDSTAQAVFWYTRARELNNRDMLSGIRLVELFAFADDLLRADSLSSEILRIDSVPRLLRLRGEILYRMKDYSQAYSCFEPLLKTGTSDPVLLRLSGACLYFSGETTTAINMLSTAHLIKPDDEITCYYLAMAYQSIPDYKSSELFFKAAVTNGISPNVGNYYHRMAEMYETAGNYKASLEAFMYAVQYRSANDNVHAVLNAEIGRIYEVYFEDYENASSHYRNFLKTYSDTTDHKYKSIKKRIEIIDSLKK